MRKKVITAAVVLSCAGFGFTACNKGGETICRDYNGMKVSDQDATVEKYFKDRQGKDPSSQELSGVKALVDTYCTINPDRPIQSMEDIGQGINDVLKGLSNLLPH